MEKRPMWSNRGKRGDMGKTHFRRERKISIKKNKQVFLS